MALSQLSETVGISDLRCSPLYKTSAVSDIPQPPYLNAVVQFTCVLSCEALWDLLQKLEKNLGKMLKKKNEPRLIDLDLLFYGDLVFYSQKLVLPHPKWHKRLFVLAPLADLTDTIPLGLSIHEMLKKFSNPHNEKVEKCGILI